MENYSGLVHMPVFSFMFLHSYFSLPQSTFLQLAVREKTLIFVIFFFFQYNFLFFTVKSLNYPNLSVFQKTTMFASLNIFRSYILLFSLGTQHSFLPSLFTPFYSSPSI